VICAVALAVVLGGGWTLAAHLDDRRELDSLRVQATEAADDLVDVEARGAAAGRRLALLIADLASTTSALANTELATRAATASAAGAGAARDEANAGIEVVRSELAGAEQSLDLVRYGLDLQGGDIDALRSCLEGISQAMRALADGDPQGAVAVMAWVTTPCGRAEQSIAGRAGAAPVLPYDFPDPFVVEHDGAYHGYATNGGGSDIQLVRSADLVTWEWLGSALQALPAWAAPGRTWAPSVLHRGDTWVMYYTAHETASGDQCTTFATASHPAGPFADTSSEPFLCQRGEGGSIDPSPFLDVDGRPWLVWKGEGETVGGTASLWSQRLSDDGRHLVGEASRLLLNDREWERRTIEGPSMVAGPGGYHLFYSAGSWQTSGYAVGHAVCASPAGPCTKQGGRSVLGSSGMVTGPGGQEVLRAADGGLRLVFHAWTGLDTGYPNKRGLHVAHLSFDATTPVITR
jgi:hypothetical protein